MEYKIRHVEDADEPQYYLALRVRYHGRTIRFGKTCMSEPKTSIDSRVEEMRALASNVFDVPTYIIRI